MQIENLDLDKKLILAPMADVTDTPFRTIMRKFGAGLTFTQMVSADGVAKGNFETLRLLSYSRDEKPIGVQLLGNDPKIITAAIKELKRLKPDHINLNCGCPVAKVIGNCMGSHLLKDPILLGELTSAMREAAGDIPVSLKLRLGFDKNKINIVENSKIIEENGASSIIIHARTKVDRYNDSVDYKWLREVKKEVSIPVIGNGSLFTPQDVFTMIEETGCDSALIARGALGNPFLFDRYNKMKETGIDPGEPGIELVAKTALEHMELIFRDQGEIKGLDRAKKNIIWYFMYQDGIDELLNKIFSASNRIEIKNIVEEHTSRIIAGKCPGVNKEDIKNRFNNRILFWLTD